MRLHPAAWSLFLLLAVGLVVAGGYALQPRAAGTPDVSLATLDNETFQLSAEKGKVVVLDFFNIYCESCTILEAEIRSLVPGWNGSEVRVVSIGLPPGNSREELEAYAIEHNLTWTVAIDTDRALEKFSVFALPTLAIVDASGDTVFRRSGPVDAAEIDEVVTQSLAEQRLPVEYARYSIWGLAVVAAVASFFSPCAIGLLPGYVAHTVRFPGSSAGGRLRRAASFGVLAALGLLLVFLGLGGLALALRQVAAPYLGLVAPLAGFLFILVGVLLLARPYSIALQRVFSPLTQISGAPDASASRGGLSYFLYGIGYGAGAAGCSAPVLLGLVGLALNQAPHVALGLVLLYSVSAALLLAILTVVVAGGREGIANWIRRNAHAVEVASALVFVFAGAFLVWYAYRAGTLPL